MGLRNFLNMLALMLLFYGAFVRGLILYGKTQNRLEGVAWLIAGVLSMNAILSWLASHAAPETSNEDIALRLMIGLILAWKTVSLRKGKGVNWSYQPGNTEALRK